MSNTEKEMMKEDVAEKEAAETQDGVETAGMGELKKLNMSELFEKGK